MTKPTAKSRFKAKLMQPAKAKDDSWSFLVLPKEISEKLPRRGMTTIEGTMNGHAFQTTLEPDGQLSHWLKVNKQMREAAGVNVGETITLEVMPVEEEPDPEVPKELKEALDASPEAQAMWSDITTIARLDWIHWITSAKQAKTRTKRITNACDMLASGKKRVCCFDQSGFYSKSFSAPEAAD